MVIMTHKVQGHGTGTQEPHYFAKVTDGNIIVSFLHDGGATLASGKACGAETKSGRRYYVGRAGWTALPLFGDGVTEPADVAKIEALVSKTAAVPVVYIGETTHYSIIDI